MTLGIAGYPLMPTFAALANAAPLRDVVSGFAPPRAPLLMRHLLIVLVLTCAFAAPASAQDTTAVPPQQQLTPAPEAPVQQPPPAAPPVQQAPQPPPAPQTDPAPLPAEPVDPDTAMVGPAQVDPAVADTLIVPAGPNEFGLFAPPQVPQIRHNAPRRAALAGVVWIRPGDPLEAAQELQAMRLAGVRAVRTQLIDDERLLRLADTLGVALFQELPYASLPAASLMRRLPEAEQLLTRSLELAARHPSARHFGLALYSDSSHPRTRSYFQRLTALVRERGPEGTQTYYVTRFVEGDRNAQLVDFVLVDARDRNPLNILQRWRASQQVPVGVAALGAGMRPGSEGGWRSAGTPAAQARFLENHLTALFETADQPVAVFVYKWQEGRLSLDDLAHSQQAAARGLSYGLIDEEGNPRPSFEVVSGLFTGTQTVFAFDAGEERDQAGGDILLLFGWAILIALGVLLALEPRLSSLGGRYFSRHVLFRDTLGRSRELGGRGHFLLLILLALSAGVVVAASLRGLADSGALAVATARLIPEAQTLLSTLLSSPLILVLVVAALYLLPVLFTMVWLLILSGRKYRLRPLQALVLIAWSRWAVFVLLIGAMLLSSLAGDTADRLAPFLFVAWLLVEIVAFCRVIIDFTDISRLPPGRGYGVGMLVPLALLGLVVIVLLVGASAELAFLWNIATRS